MRRVAAPTRTMLDWLQSDYRHDRPGVVLPNGCDPSAFTAGAKEDVVFAAGRLWDAAKNLAALDAAAPGLPWPVQVAGPASAPDGSGAATTAHAVHGLGELPRTELAQRLARAAIYALPARYEPFGLSVLEAALSGCALVLGDIPTLREIWGAAALYVPPNDPAALHATRARLIAAPAERQRLAAAARQRALHFSPRRMGEATLAAYARLQPAFAAPASKELSCAS